MSLIEICKQAGVNKSRAFTILHTLQKSGLVQRNVEKKGYSLGPTLVSLSRRFLDGLNPLKLAEPVLKKLAIDIGGTVVLGMIAEEHVFVAAKYESERDIEIVTTHIGHRFPLTHGSHGKAIAAFLPKEDLNRLLQQDNSASTGTQRTWTGIDL